MVDQTSHQAKTAPKADQSDDQLQIHSVPVAETTNADSARDRSQVIADYKARIQDLETELLKSRRASRQSERRFRTLMNTVPHLVWHANSSGGIELVSHQWLQYTGTKPEDFALGLRYTEVVHPNDITKIQAAVAVAREHKTILSVEHRLRTGSGHYRWNRVHGNPVFDEDTREFRGWIGTTTDIHEQKLLQESLALASQQSEAARQELYDLIMQTPVGIALLSGPEHRYSVVNSAFLATFGRNPVGQTVRAAFTAGEAGHSIPLLDGVYQSGEPFIGNEIPFPRQNPNGEITELYLNVHYYPFRRIDGSIQGVLAFVQDVTVQVVARKAIEQSQREFHELAENLKVARRAAESANESKSAFLANMSHEIRTPIGVIQGFADLLSERVVEDEQRAWVETIRRNTRQLTGLIGEILDLSKVEADKLDIEKVPFPLTDLIEDIKASMSFKAEEKNLSLTFSTEADLPRLVVTDPTRLRQILINLIGNSIKFTEVGGVHVSFSAGQKPDHLRVSVTDTGIGLTPKQQTKIFEPFVQADSSMTRRFGGTGLGLSISRKLATALNGELKISSSELGRGTTFELILCCLKHEEQIGIRLAPKNTADFKGNSFGIDFSTVRILLVEDSADNRALVENMLKDTGAKLSFEPNGKLGVERALKDSFDIVLMDIQMPEMDGYQAMTRLRGQGYQVPVLALTAHALKEERERALDLGFDDYLTKPLTKSTLINAIANTLTELRKA